MALHDFRCPGCGDVEEIDIPIRLGARAAHIKCANCNRRMDWIPQIGRMDFGPSGGAGFKAFTIEEEIRGVPHRIEIDSLTKLRQVERESEQRTRNGEGRPLIWRDYQQDRSNRDVHTLASNLGTALGSDAPAPDPGTFTPRRGDAVTKQHGTL